MFQLIFCHKDHQRTKPSSKGGGGGTTSSAYGSASGGGRGFGGAG